MNDRPRGKAALGPWRGRRAFLVSLASLVGSVALSSCMLSSGALQSLDTQPEAGNLTASFLSAEGEELSAIETGISFHTYEIIAIVSVEQGELALELYDGSGAPAFNVQGRPDQEVTRTGRLASDERGDLRYRVTARGARNGSYQILYRRVP
jgi:hypothetical protein